MQLRLVATASLLAALGCLLVAPAGSWALASRSAASSVRIGQPGAAVGRAAGTCFEVFCHGGDDATAAQALAVVEPVWPFVCAVFGVAAQRPAELLPVHLYSTLAAYEQIDRERAGGRFEANQAFCDWGQRCAHVALQPPSPPAIVAEFGLPMQTQAMLAWEACHLARFALCPDFRQHPGWFVDGLAATAARHVLEQLHPGCEEQPFFGQRHLRVRQLLQAGKLPPIAELVTQSTSALAMRDRYAVRAALVQFLLGDRRSRLLAVARLIRSPGGGVGRGGRVAAAAHAAFAGSDEAFHRWLATIEPDWDEWQRSLWCRGDRWRQNSFPARSAVAWRRQPITGSGFRAAGEVCILAGGSPRPQLNFLFARTARGYYSLALTAGVGFTLSEHRYAGNIWQHLCSRRAPELGVGAFHSFVVRAVGARVEVRLAGRRWQFELPRPLPATVVWGVGAQAGASGEGTGCAGIWRGVTVTPLGPGPTLLGHDPLEAGTMIEPQIQLLGEGLVVDRQQ